MPFSIEPSREIAFRTDFSLLANARGYLDCVEVGTDLGVFAVEFMSRFEGNWLVCVDEYAPYPGYPNDRGADMATALQALAPYHGRFRLIRARSVDVAAHYPEWLNDPGFVYLDAGHAYEDVRQDIAAWWPRVAAGGCLAGHDHDDDHPGVVRAVREFAESHGLVVRLTSEEASPPSWYVYKGEPATLHRRFFAHRDEPNPHAAGGS